MGSSEPAESLITLGKKIVAELGAGNSVDTLGRWMAHHIAELIQETESATGGEREIKRTQLREAILAIWAHRFELPTGSRPFEEVEPILRALNSLDPEDDYPRYFRQGRAPGSSDEEPEEAKQWLDLAAQLDDASKILIRYCLTAAAQPVLDDAEEWGDLAIDAGLEEGFEIRIIRTLGSESDLFSSEQLTSYQIRMLEERHAKLKALLSLASTLADNIEARLNAVRQEPPAEGSESEDSISPPPL